MTEQVSRQTFQPVLRGQIWTAKLNPNRGSELGKVRPVLVIQGDWLSRVRAQAEPLRVTLNARDGLREDSQVIVEQPSTLDRRRLGDGPLTQVSREEMSKVETSLLAVLGFEQATLLLA